MIGILRRLRPSPHDRGMTLIEVVIAISILAIVATAAVGLSITSVASAAVQQRTQIAVTVANQAMETASAQADGIDPATTVSYLLKGRSQTDVMPVWTANSARWGIPTSYAGWDPTVGPGSAWLLGTLAGDQTTLSGTIYRTDILVGTCYQKSTGGDCSLLPGYSVTAPAVTPAGYVVLMRVVVVVTWTAGSGCQSGGCSYQTTSLIDTHDELAWNKT